MADTYGEAVGRRLAANEGSGGWDQTPAALVGEAIEEALDIWRELRRLQRGLSR